MTKYSFHPDALVEYEDATRYYLEQASPIVAAAFVAAVESAVQAVLASPMMSSFADPRLLTPFLFIPISRPLF
jgi:plasmid stabilization system protein ParE